MPRSNGWQRSGDKVAVKCRIWICAGLLLSLASGCDSTNHAAPQVNSANSLGIEVMGLKSQQMQYYAAQQEASNWCWAACVQMTLSAQGITVSQAEIVANASGGLVFDRPGTARDVLANLNGVMRDVQGEVIRLQATPGWGPPSFELLRRQFDQDLPLIIGYSIPGQEVGHAAVVTAVIFEWQNGQPYIHKILVRDPAPWLRSSGGKRELSRDEFHRIFVHYLVTPQQL